MELRRVRRERQQAVLSAEAERVAGTTKKEEAIVDLKRLVTGTLGLRGRKIRRGRLAFISVANDAALHRRRMVARIADWRATVVREFEVQRATVMTDAQMKRAAATRPTTTSKIKRLLMPASVATAGQVEMLGELILTVGVCTPGAGDGSEQGE